MLYFKQRGSLYYAKTNKKKTGIVILISDSRFRIRKVIRDKEHYIMIKWAILQKDKTILNVYAHINRVPNHTKEKLIEIQRNRWIHYYS